MDPNASVAAALLAAFQTKNLHEAPLAENVRYTSPLAGEEMVVGRENVIRFLGAYLPFINTVTVLRMITEGHDVCALWRVESPFGPLTIVYLLRIRNGEVDDILASYDPRPFLEGLAGHGG